MTAAKNIAFFLFAITVSCSRNDAVIENAVKQVSPKEFSQLLGTQKGILLDVRTPAEWEKRHIKGAIHLDIFRDDFETELNKLDTNITCFVYCAMGGRSTEASEILYQKGFDILYNMEGGFARWRNEGLPFEYE
jgi:rhodanese-related sulfurtransferase